MLFRSLTSLSVLALLQLVAALSPGTYTIQSVAFPEKRVVGTDSTNEGVPLTTFSVSPNTGLESASVFSDRVSLAAFRPVNKQ